VVQVLAVSALRKPAGQPNQLLPVNKPSSPCNFLGAGDLESLSTLKGHNELPSFQKTMKDATGAAFIITRVCASPPTAFSCSNDSRESKKTPLDYKRLPYPKASARAGLGPVQRHIPWSIATVRHRLACAIARRLPQCPCCGKSYRRARD
jgi:hypothetical protein